MNGLKRIHYPNLRSFMKRYGFDIGDIAKVINKTYPSTHKKITRKETKSGKVAMFDIEEARKIIAFVIETEKSYLQEKYRENWKDEWEARWGHIDDWFNYIFFDEVVTYATKTA